MTIEKLARARYPEIDIRLAVLYFKSDRRKAGLGALANTKSTGSVKCRKQVVGIPERVQWMRAVAERDYYVVPNFSDNLLMDSTIRHARIPARCYVVAFWRDQFDYLPRDYFAAMLREMRKKFQEPKP